MASSNKENKINALKVLENIENTADNEVKFINIIVSKIIQTAVDSYILEKSFAMQESERKKKADESELAAALDALLNKIEETNNDDVNLDINTDDSCIKKEIQTEINSEIEYLEQENNLNLAISKKPLKLGIFSIRVVNAIANSFMGVPAAVIVIAADQILTGTTFVFMSTPDKIFILALASAILITFLILAYKSEAKINNHPQISNSINSLFQLSTIIDISGKSDYISRVKSEAELEKSIKKIRLEGLYKEDYFPKDSIYAKLLKGEIDFYNENKKLDENTRKRKYIDLYNHMRKFRKILKKEGVESENINNYIESINNEEINKYIQNYYAIVKKENNNTDDNSVIKGKEWYLLDKKLKLLDTDLVVTSKNKDTFSNIGNVIGIINAFVNGILCCTFGIGGITAFALIFFPGFNIPLIIAIPVAIALFLAGTIHSMTITRGFMRNSFENFGKMLDKEATQSPQKTTFAWLKLIFEKIFKNRKILLISLVTSIGITTLATLSVVIFIATTPISPVFLTLIATVVGVLTFTSCNTSFNSVLMKKAREEKAQAVLLENFLNDEEKKAYKVAQKTKKNHSIISISLTIMALLLFITFQPLSIGLITPLMISSVLGCGLYLILGAVDSKNIIAANIPSENKIRDIIKLRARILVALIFGVSFSITAGPAIATLIFTSLALTSPTLAFVTSILCGLTIAISLYYVMPLIYWDVALKPSHKFLLNSPTKEQHHITQKSNNVNANTINLETNQVHSSEKIDNSIKLSKNQSKSHTKQ